MNEARLAKSAFLSDTGRVRSSNQDACADFADTEGFQLFVVADGMGGHRGGDVASRTALAAIEEVFRKGFQDPERMLRDAFRAANDHIQAGADADLKLHGMGTTAVALLLGPTDRAWTANVGDSRLYRLRNDRLEALTEDHSWVSNAVRRGRISSEEALRHPDRNVLLRAIGVAPVVECDVTSVALASGDRFLLCSDGLWSEVDEEQIASILAGAEPKEAVSTLVDIANRNGGSDNVTVQVVHPITGEPSPAVEPA